MLARSNKVSHRETGNAMQTNAKALPYKPTGINCRQTYQSVQIIESGNSGESVCNERGKKTSTDMGETEFNVVLLFIETILLFKYVNGNDCCSFTDLTVPHQICRHP